MKVTGNQQHISTETTEDLVVVIPVYKQHLNVYETISLKRCIEAFSDSLIILAAPCSLNIESYFLFGKNIASARFEDRYFKDIAAYNKLMMSSTFYSRFLMSKYMLIYQLDAFVFENNIDDWIRKGYDYIGAPWIDTTWIEAIERKYHLPNAISRVGNGGLSLRNTRSFYWGSILLWPLAQLWRQNEDIFWAMAAHRLLPWFSIPSAQEAVSFAFEDCPAHAFEMNGQKLPFGCHAWERYDVDFWRPHFAKYGYDI